MERANFPPGKTPGVFRKPAILEHESAASKQTANPQGPIAGAFSELAD
jgi:hypothetical protein